MDANLLYRSMVLSLAGNRGVTALASRYGMRMGAGRFVAGVTLADALEQVRQLNDRGLVATLDHLGEGITEEAQARASAQAYLQLLDGIKEAGVNSNVSLKLTQMGLDIRPELAAENLTAIVAKAQETGNFVRIDMEDTPYVDVTLDLYKHLRREYNNLGIVLQSYLFRTEGDLQAIPAGDNIRLVKGAYKVPADLAYQKKQQIDESYKNLLDAMIKAGHYVGVATHDDRLIEHAKSYPKEQFEFQMLYGVRAPLQEQLAQEGYKVRVYVPYGEQWYPYFTRRIAEAPRSGLFVLRAVFGR